MPGSSFLPPKRCTSLQQPIASTRCSASSRALTTSRPLRRHGAHEVVELALDRGQVVEDVGVVELEVVEDRGARPVVDELAALVEERGVVLVGLDHERRRRVAEARRDAEVERHAADQEARRSGRRCSRIQASIDVVVGLAVRAGDGEHVAAGSTCSASHCGPLV